MMGIAVEPAITSRTANVTAGTRAWRSRCFGLTDKRGTAIHLPNCVTGLKLLCLGPLARYGFWF